MKQDIDALVVAISGVSETLEAMASDVADILVTIQAMHLDTLTGSPGIDLTEREPGGK